MRVVLLESSKPRSRPFGQGLASVLLHAGAVGAAVYATAGAAPRTDRPLGQADMVFLPPPPPALPAPASPPDAAMVSPVPLGFQTVPPVLDVPITIPPPDLGRGFDPRAYTGIGQEGGRPDGISGMDPSPVSDPLQVLTAEQVDQPVSPIYQPSPRYPPTLREMGVSGRVVVRYVVDTLGLVEPDSWMVVRTDAEGFAAAAREAVLRSRFAPARIRGRAVRQLVEQPIAFTVR